MARGVVRAIEADHVRKFAPAWRYSDMVGFDGSDNASGHVKAPCLSLLRGPLRLIVCSDEENNSYAKGGKPLKETPCVGRSTFHPLRERQRAKDVGCQHSRQTAIQHST